MKKIYTEQTNSQLATVAALDELMGLGYDNRSKFDENIMKEAGIAPYEKLLISNIENGARFETYAITGAPGSKIIGLNGAAARLGAVGDKLIVMIFGIYDEGDAPSPKVLIFDENNNIVEIIEDK